MASAAQTISGVQAPLAWFNEFLKRELLPYPGRVAKVARMVIAATIMMILVMTFRIPFGPYAAIYTFMISRESPRETVKSTLTEALVFACTAIYIVLGAMLFLSHPMMRLLCVITTLFLMFFATGTMTNYTAAARFGWLIVITIPLWDLHTTAEARLEGMLWAVAAIALASLITVIVELIFAELQPGDELSRFLADRLRSIEELLDCFASGSPAGAKIRDKITGQAMLGTSGLRRIIQRSNYTPLQAEQMGAVVALVGRLVDVAANASYLTPESSAADQQRIRVLTENVGTLREDLLNRRIPQSKNFDGEISTALPQLREMETAVLLIGKVFSGTHAVNMYAPPSTADPQLTLFARDALSNPEHIKFALKGCLAASLCYVVYNAIDWPGISTAVTTCFSTALSTIGSSRQKQVLRISGALVGAALGLGAQIFVLPHLDSIAGFTVLFVSVTTLGAWIATSSPRLSYVGLQLVLAFYIINLQEFTIQTSLAPARDRLVGILLGLVMMWFVFDQLWGIPVIILMKKALISQLRMLAHFSREPLSADYKLAAERSYTLREGINKNFDSIRASADAILFEFGPSRQAGLAWRNSIRLWQPRLRTLFLTRIALWKYRAQLPGFELPDTVLASQHYFDQQSAELLDSIADRLEGKRTQQKADLEESFERVEQAVRSCGLGQLQKTPEAQLGILLQLCSRLKGLVIALNQQIPQPETAPLIQHELQSEVQVP